jgi:hypothetical protein
MTSVPAGGATHFDGRVGAVVGVGSASGVGSAVFSTVGEALISGVEVNSGGDSGVPAGEQAEKSKGKKIVINRMGFMRIPSLVNALKTAQNLSQMLIAPDRRNSICAFVGFPFTN